METLKRLNSAVYESVAREPDPQLRDALCLFYGLLELIDQIESAPGLPLAVRLELCEYLFLYLDEAEEKELSVVERCPLLGDLAGQYRIVEHRYRVIIEETLVDVMTGLLKRLHNRGPVRDLNGLLQHCHYAAGLPGLGLLRMLCEAGAESARLWHGRQAEMLALGTFLQLAENLALLPRELSILPAEVDYSRLMDTCTALASDALILAKRIKSPTGQRLIVAPFHAALCSFGGDARALSSNCKEKNIVDPGVPVLVLLAAVETVLVVRLIYYCLAHR